MNVFLIVRHLSALSLKGYPGLDGAKGETGAVGSKVGFYSVCFLFNPIPHHVDSR